MLSTQETGTTPVSLKNKGGWGEGRGGTVAQIPRSQSRTLQPASGQEEMSLPSHNITERVQDPLACRSRKDSADPFHLSLLSHPPCAHPTSALLGPLAAPCSYSVSD